jgi:hypothetical protein
VQVYLGVIQNRNIEMDDSVALRHLILATATTRSSIASCEKEEAPSSTGGSASRHNTITGCEVPDDYDIGTV